jgi:hypothetical protein
MFQHKKKAHINIFQKQTRDYLLVLAQLVKNVDIVR